MSIAQTWTCEISEIGTFSIGADTVQCLRRQDRTADYFVAIIIDISELKRKEEQLQFNEHRFRSMFKLSPVPLVLNDMNGSIIYLNDRFIELFGYTLADIPSTKEWFPSGLP